MPTEDCKRLLDRDLAVASAKPLIDQIVPTLREVINYSLWALWRCGEVGDHDGRVHNTVPLLLFRHVIEMSDGLETLLQQCCVVPAIPILRSSFEACLGLEYILNSDTENRSLGWLCCFAHQQIEYYERLDPSTTAGKSFESVRQRELTGSAERHPNVIKAIKNLRDLLAMPYMVPIETEYQQRSISRETGKQKPVREWYRLFGGPNDLRSLAAGLKHQTEYDLLYRKWSRLAHGNDLEAFVANSPDGNRCFKSLRYPAELHMIGALSVKCLLSALVEITNHFRSDEFSRDKWIAEMAERVREFSQPIERIEFQT